MGKSKNSRYQMNKYLLEDYDENYFDHRANATVKFSRHPNKKKHSNLHKEGQRYSYYSVCGDYRVGDCFDRSDRRRKLKYEVKRSTKTKMKEETRRIIDDTEDFNF